MTQAPQGNYRFKTPGERITTFASAAAGLTALGVGLSAIFNPLALAVAGGYAAVKIGQSALISAVPAYRNWAFEHLVKQGHGERIAEDTDIYRLTKQVSDDLGRPTPPKIYTIDTKVVADMALPLGLRWLGKIQAFKEMLHEKAMPKVFAAVPGANTMLTTKEALAAKRPEDQMRFVVAHEMSHLKADGLNPSLYAQAAMKKVTQPLMLAVVAGLALSLVGVTLPISALGVGAFGLLKAGAALVALKYGAGAAINLGMRVTEKRADRNGLYVTRDLKAAQGVMEWLHEPSQKKPSGPLKEATLDHPSYTKRMAALKTSFNTVAKYPPLQPINDNAAPAATTTATRPAMRMGQR